METWKLIVDIFQGISVIFASLLAIYGIDSWRREFQGKRQIELAEETLALFYEAREAIMSIRSIGGYEGEGKSRQRKEGETPEQKAARDKAFVFLKGTNAIKNFLQNYTHHEFALWQYSESNFRNRLMKYPQCLVRS